MKRVFAHIAAMVGLVRWSLNKLRKWWREKFYKAPAPVVYNVPMGSDGNYQYRHTKAYADQRQKAPWNRKKKPSKAMRNLYKL